MSLPPPKVCKKIQQLHAMLGSTSENEAGNARTKLNKLLAEHGLTWARAASASAAPQASTEAPTVNVLDLVLRLIELHIAVTPTERMAIALWILHCWLFDQFTITPRLALLSPVRRCGKTTLLALIELLVDESFRIDEVSPATVFHQIDARPNTALLVDEGDNLGLLNNRVLRSVFNSGHRKGGGVGRFVGGWSRKYLTFAPLAVAAIGMLPLPLMDRAVVINMRRYAPGAIQIQQLNESDPSFPAAREQIRRWVATCSLAGNPEIPASLRNRAADNWRMELCTNRLDEDIGVVLLSDIRTVFVMRGIDRISSLALVKSLHELGEGLWAEWRGAYDNRNPHKLTQYELAGQLRLFGIKPRTIWPMHRQPSDKSARGYMRSQLADAWAAYCTTADTSSQASKIIRLPRR